MISTYILQSGFAASSPEQISAETAFCIARQCDDLKELMERGSEV